jgi:hypothetical protein
MGNGSLFNDSLSAAAALVENDVMQRQVHLLLGIKIIKKVYNIRLVDATSYVKRFRGYDRSFWSL